MPLPSRLLLAAGADCLTLGDHAWDQREALTYIEREPRLLRPLNYPAGTLGQGSTVWQREVSLAVLVE